MKKTEKNIKFYEAVGRRKTSVARVRFYLVNKDKVADVNGQKTKQGEIVVNNLPVEKFFSRDYQVNYLKEPLKLTNNEDRFAISILVKGGGKTGQLDAIVHGIAQALVLVDESYKPLLRQQGWITRDPRKKERRKVGTGGKARREKQSPKR
jgi:small subunit ribosomal protein S9